MAAAFVDADVVMRVPRPALVDHARTAHGALVVHWAVPGDEIALRVALAAVELAPLAADALQELRAALGAGHADALGQRQRVAAGGEVGAGEELAVAAHLVDHHRPALFAGDVGHLILNGDLFDAGLGLFQILFKRPVEIAHDGVPVHLAVFHVVEFFLHVGGELYVDDVGEVFAH